MGIYEEKERLKIKLGEKKFKGFSSEEEKEKRKNKLSGKGSKSGCNFLFFIRLNRIVFLSILPEPWKHYLWFEGKIKRFFTLDLSQTFSCKPHFSLENSLHKLLRFDPLLLFFCTLKRLIESRERPRKNTDTFPESALRREKVNIQISHN